MVQAADFTKTLQLTVLSPSTQTEWDIRTTDLNRPGMQFCGFYEYFPFERPQVIGKVEMTYLENLEPEVRRQMLKKYFSFDIPCVIICRGMHPPEELLEAAAARNIAVYQTGKSEAALELIRRGHQLVADDVVDICRVSDNRLTGECPEMVRHFMEIRGIGIIDIRAMYGIGAVAQSKSIDLVIHMEKWVEGKEYDRLGLNDEYITILGVKVPSQTMPVRPGRNLAIIIEVAARNLSMKKLGFSAARELDRRMNEMIMKRSNPDAQNQD